MKKANSHLNLKRDKLQILRSKRSQTKIQEMSFMLVGLVILFAIIAIFALSLLYGTIKKSANISKEERVVSGIMNLANSPEFSCVGSKMNCIDSDKAMAMSGKIIYNKLLTNINSLSIIKQSALNKTRLTWIKCMNSNYPNCDYIEIYSKTGIQETKSTFVSLCRNQKEENYLYEKCEIGKIEAGIA
jgi:hypothetical protein